MMHRLIIGLATVMLAGAFAGAQDDPALRELDECLNALLDVTDGPARLLHGFDLHVHGEPQASVRVTLSGEEVEEFLCPRFSLDRGPNGRRARWVADGQERERAVGPGDLNGLRAYLALDPFWVIHRVRNRLELFQYSADAGTGRAVYSRWERVPLAAPEEKLYGTFEEILIVDTAAHQVVSYHLLALNEDRRPVQDMLNVYAYQRARGPAWVRIRQTHSGAPDGGDEHKIQY